MTTDTRPQLTWSKLTDKPVICYHPRSDSYPVYWKGVGMVRESALLIASGFWNITYSSPKMKRAAYDEFRRALMLGAFGDVTWGSSMSDDPGAYHSYLTKKVNSDHDGMSELIRTTDPRTALSWFMPSKAEVLED